VASLIDWLKYSGARTSTGAVVASGSAWFFQPDTTSTQVTVYSDEDGLTPVTQPVTLDAAGKATVYTKTPVRVEIQDSTGARVDVTDRSNTISAAQVEIENTVATGTSLTTGTQVAGGRTDLNTFLSSLRESLGAADGNVLVDGVSTSLKNALYGLSSVYNVKRYGAVGDGTTDDTVAVQAAITALSNAGGGTIWLPDGVYKLTSALTVPASTNARFVGTSFGSNGSGTGAGVTLKQTTAATPVFNATNLVASFENIEFYASNATATLFTGLNGCRFVNCWFNGASGAPSQIGTTGGNSQYVNCTFSGGSGAGTYFTGSTSTFLSNCMMDVGAVTSVWPAVNVFASGCLFSSVTATALLGSGGARGMFSGCFFGATPITAATDATVYEAGCHVPSTGIGVYFNASTWRDSNMNRTSGSATSYAADASLYKFHYVISTGASFQWSNPTNTGNVNGRELVLIYKNTSGGAVTPTYGAAIKANTAVSVANGSACAWHLVWNNADSIWMHIGTIDDYAA
jgi:pectate lyase-like protein